MSELKTFNTLSPSTWSLHGLILDTYREKELGIYTSTHHLNKLFRSATIGNGIYEFSLVLFYEVYTLPLRLPFINFITYIAYSAIFQANLDQKYEEALNEGNLGGAFVLTERGADVTGKNKNGKSLVDLFLAKFEQSEPSEEEVQMVYQLIEKGTPCDKNHPGLSPLFQKATKIKHNVLLFSLLQKEIFPALDLQTDITELEIKENLWCFDADITQLINDLNKKKHPLVIVTSKTEETAFSNYLWEKVRPRSLVRINLKTFITNKGGKTAVEISKLQEEALRLSKTEKTIFILDNLYSIPEAFPYFKEHFLDKVSAPYIAFTTQKPKSDGIFTPIYRKSLSNDESLIILHNNRSLIEQFVDKTISRDVYITAIDFATRYYPLEPYAITAFDLIKAAHSKLESQLTKGSFLLQAKRIELAKLKQEEKVLLIKKPDSVELTKTQEKWEAVSNEILVLEKEHSEYLGYVTEMKKLKSIYTYLFDLEGFDPQALSDLSQKIQNKMTQIESEIKQLPSYKMALDTSLIAMVVSEKLNIPIDDVGQDEKEKLLKLEGELNQEIIGQEQAVKAVTEVILSTRLGIKQNDRPAGVFLCVGPTGVGKTSLAKLLAKKIMGSEEKLIRINMELYSEKHTVSNIIGSPVGYKGHEKGAAWLKELQQNPRSVILLDEIEKSHQNVKQVFLSAFDEGFFTDNEGKKVDCSHAIFILTSNAGSREILSHGNAPKGWFAAEEESLDTVVNRAISREFKPEFINRIDKVIVFNKLDNRDVAKKIITHELKLFNDLLEKAQGITLTYTDNLISYLAAKGFDPKMGARPLKRIIQSTIRPLCTNAILSGILSRGDPASLDITEEGTLILTKMVK